MAHVIHGLTNFDQSEIKSIGVKFILIVSLRIAQIELGCNPIT